MQMEGVARLLRSLALTTDTISGLSHIPADRIRSIMEGAPASLPELRALAQGLRIPMRSFAAGHTPAQNKSELGLLFRGAIDESKPGQRSTIESVAAFVEAATKIMSPQATPPAWLQELVPTEQTFTEAHRIAHRFRNIFMRNRLDDAATDLPQIIATEGQLIVSALRMSRYEGASIISGGYGFVFVSPRFQARMLFTVAHELGHIIAHHSAGNGAVFDGASRIGSWRQQTINERFVDAFASILLLPERGIALALQAIRSVLSLKTRNIGDVQILYLARFFGVSFEVAARRCEQLELLPTGGAFSLTEALKRDYGSPERRADQLGLPPRSKVVVPAMSDNLLFTVIAKIEAREISTGWAAEMFGLSIEELFEAHARFARERRN